MKQTVMYCHQGTDHKGKPWLQDFYPNAFCVRICGHKENILKVEVVEDDSGKTDSYWGWWDAEKEKFQFVYAAKMLLNMCFAYGMKAEEDRGRGKGMPVRIQVLEEVSE